MKHIIPAMLAVAISLVPFGAVAGEPSAPGMPPMPPGMIHGVELTSQQRQQMVQIMVQSHQQLEQLHTQGRLKILGSLTAAHRALVAQVIGNLAVSANPDRAGAVRQINAALSPAESQAVLATHSALEQQMHTVMENVHQQFLSMLTAQQRASMNANEQNEQGEKTGMDEMHEMHGSAGQQHPTFTAGDILLHLSESDEGGHMMGMGMGPGMGMPHP